MKKRYQVIGSFKGRNTRIQQVNTEREASQKMKTLRPGFMPKEGNNDKWEKAKKQSVE